MAERLTRFIKNPLVQRGVLLTSILSAIACAQESTVPNEPQLITNTAYTEPVFETNLMQTQPALVPEPEPTVEKKLAAKRICIDPGHDNYWVVGATGRDSSGRVPTHPTEKIPLYEHELTLRVAYKLKDLLELEGADVCVTRREDGKLQIEPYDFTGDGRVRTAAFPEDNPERTQPRIDFANNFGAQILVSVHFNGAEDKNIRGTEVYYSDTGANREENRRLAQNLLKSLLTEIEETGAKITNRGVSSDKYMRYSYEETARSLTNNAKTIIENGHNPNNCPDCLGLITLGNNPMSLNPGHYIGALVEVEFLSNPQVVETFLTKPDSLDIIAGGLAKGIIVYFNEQN